MRRIVQFDHVRMAGVGHVEVDEVPARDEVDVVFRGDHVVARAEELDRGGAAGGVAPGVLVGLAHADPLDPQLCDELGPAANGGDGQRAAGDEAHQMAECRAEGPHRRLSDAQVVRDPPAAVHPGEQHQARDMDGPWACRQQSGGRLRSAGGERRLERSLRRLAAGDYVELSGKEGAEAVADEHDVRDRCVRALGGSCFGIDRVQEPCDDLVGVGHGQQRERQLGADQPGLGPFVCDGGTDRGHVPRRLCVGVEQQHQSAGAIDGRGLHVVHDRVSCRQPGRALRFILGRKGRKRTRHASATPSCTNGRGPLQLSGQVADRFLS